MSLSPAIISRVSRMNAALHYQSTPPRPRVNNCQRPNDTIKQTPLILTKSNHSGWSDWCTLRAFFGGWTTTRIPQLWERDILQVHWTRMSPAIIAWIIVNSKNLRLASEFLALQTISESGRVFFGPSPSGRNRVCVFWQGRCGWEYPALMEEWELITMLVYRWTFPSANCKARTSLTESLTCFLNQF